MNIVFMGTPAFAATVLEHLLEWCSRFGRAEITAAYCQPDRPAGRGRHMQSPPVKELALRHGIPVLQPLNFKTDEDRAALAALRPDVLAVAAYGLILPQAVLDIPKIGPFNVHASLLPKLRGAAPIQRAIMNGDTCTGITIMRMEAGLDTGPMLAQRALVIGPDDTAGDIEAQLANMGGRLLSETLERLAGGERITAIPQNNELASHAAKLNRADGLLDWERSAAEVHAQLRGVTPRPGGRSVIELSDREIPILLQPGETGPSLESFALEGAAQKGLSTPGQVLGLLDGRLAIACADAAYLIRELRPADRGLMDAKAFWNGHLRGQNARMRLPTKE